ncbi:MAG TPA: hypothetical protein VF469_27295 [Kofleriaceae bacterium]
MIRAAGLALAVCLAGGACSRRAPIASCDDDLRGVYTSGTERGERWMVLDDRDTLEAYPLFPDSDGPADLVVAPRVIELVREGRGELSGTSRRRYMRRAQRCDAHVPVHVTRCAGDAIELVIADPAPPIEMSPCTWPGPGPSRVERWRRE